MREISSMLEIEKMRFNRQFDFFFSKYGSNRSFYLLLSIFHMRWT